MLSCVSGILIIITRTMHTVLHEIIITDRCVHALYLVEMSNMINWLQVEPVSTTDSICCCHKTDQPSRHCRPFTPVLGLPSLWRDKINKYQLGLTQRSLSLEADSCFDFVHIIRATLSRHARTLSVLNRSVLEFYRVVYLGKPGELAPCFVVFRTTFRWIIFTQR